MKLPGGVEAKLAALHDEVKDAEAKAEAAVRGQNQLVQLAMTPREIRAASAGAMGSEDPTVPLEQRLGTLAEAYNNGRSNQTFSPSRTAALTGIVREMVDACRGSTDHALYERLALEDSIGLKLACCAWAVANSVAAMPGPVLAVAANPHQGFVQYWALLALQRIAETQGNSAFSAKNLRALQNLREVVPKDPERVFALMSVLRSLGMAPSPGLS